MNRIQPWRAFVTMSTQKELDAVTKKLTVIKIKGRTCVVDKVSRKDEVVEKGKTY